MGWLSLHMLKVRNAKFMQGLLDLLLDNMVSIFISLEISLKVAKQQGLTSIQERGLMEDPKSQKQIGMLVISEMLLLVQMVSQRWK